MTHVPIDNYHVSDEQFKEIVWSHYRSHGRSMPWRDRPTPYAVFVSEMMLQQTQVDRVIKKYTEFIERFNDFESLAGAPFVEVVKQWQGLGYNRRAKYIHEAAKCIVRHHSGELPDTLDELVALPGIGANTAGAILAYAFSAPVIFIETNIRTVIIHHYFNDNDVVRESEISAVVERLIDTDNPREWYYALMDYGAHLKSQGNTAARRSSIYKKQSAFEGSVRQLRGAIMTHLATHSGSVKEFPVSITSDPRYNQAVEGLIRDGMLDATQGIWCLTGGAGAS